MSEHQDIRTPYQLARLAEVSSPDSPTSPGARWLENVASAAAEVGGDDEVHEVADGCVPIYTHERMAVLVDLCAYTEDTSDLAYGSDMIGLAGIALYQVAERLILALMAEAAEETR